MLFRKKKREPKLAFCVSTDKGVECEGHCDSVAVLGVEGENGIAYCLTTHYERVSEHDLIYNYFRMLALLQLASEEIGQRIRKNEPELPQEAFETALRLAMRMIRDQIADAKREEINEPAE